VQTALSRLHTHIGRDASNCSERAEARLVLIGDKAAEDGVNIECGLIWGQIAQSEPQTRHAIRRMKMNLVFHQANIWARLGLHNSGLEYRKTTV
jgi:hypothetical protein